MQVNIPVPWILWVMTGLAFGRGWQWVMADAVFFLVFFPKQPTDVGVWVYFLTQPSWTLKKKRLNFIFPTKYVIPKSLKFGHWLSEFSPFKAVIRCWVPFFDKQLLSTLRQRPWTRWFKVTFLSPSWRSLNHLKGSLNHPKKATKNCQELKFKLFLPIEHLFFQENITG